MFDKNSKCCYKVQNVLPVKQCACRIKGQLSYAELFYYFTFIWFTKYEIKRAILRRKFVSIYNTGIKNDHAIDWIIKHS